LLAENESGPARLLWGLRATGRGIPRPGMAVLGPDGERVGEVTSGTFSPSLRTGIALALLDAAAGVEDSAQLMIDVRGRQEPVQVARPPFVESHVR
jgi:aminomethyltransferase